MPWFKVDDGFWGHPKRLACPLSAIGLWVAAGSWSAQQLTDGHVPRHVLAVLGGKPKDAAALVTAGLWTATPDGWRFHDWHDMQPTRTATLTRRAEDAERKRQARAEKAARRAAVQQTSERTLNGRPQDVRPESALPDPTRPDPTRSSSGYVEREVEVPDADEPDDAETARIRATLEQSIADWGHELPAEWHAR
jgi:hypothetical protein